MNGDAYLADVTLRFREAQSQCDRAIAQVPFGRWGHRLGPESNSITTLMLHLSGNMLSRWTDFLSTDGEKTDRARDTEFEDPAGLSETALRERWGRGWGCLFTALAALTDRDLERTVTIRSRPLTVMEAINRQLTHYAYHAGQVALLSKHLAAERWATLSVPRHGSVSFNAAMKKGPSKA